MPFRIFLLLFVALFNMNCFGQVPKYIHYDNSNGLSGSTVYSIVQDTSGFLWFATQNGLCKFNGRRFNNYLPEGIKNNEIIYAIADSKNRIWFSNYSGNMWVKDEHGFKKFELPKKKHQFFTALEDNEGNLFFNQFRKKGLLKVSRALTDSQQIVSLPFFKNRIVNLSSNTPGGIFLASGKIMRIDNGQLITEDALYRTSLVGRTSNKQYIFCNRYKREMFQVEVKNGKVLVEKNNNLPFTRKIFINGNKDIWFRSKDNSLKLIQGGDQIPITLIKDILINDIFQDKQENIWISTMNRGLYFFPKQQNSISVNLVLPENGRIEQLCATDDGIMAMAIGNHGMRFIKGNKEIKSYLPEIPKNLRAIEMVNYKDTIYTLFDQSNLIKSYKGVSKLISKETGDKTIAFDKDGNLWLAGIKAISCYSKGITIPCGQENTIFSLHFDSKNTLWAGGIRGLLKINRKGKSDTFLNNILVNDIISDTHDNIWVATMGSGVFKFKNGRLDTFNFLNNNCIALVYDSLKNQIWTGTNGGLARINLSDDSIRYFTQSDGLHSDEVKCLSILKNNLWVGTNKGLNVFSLEELRFSTTAPETYIETALVSNTKKSLFNETHLKHFENNIEVRFASPTYQDNELIQYRFKLNDGKWQTTSSQSLQFMDLPAGNYKLYIKAVGKNGQQQKRPTLLEFSIQPPFWKSWWFLLIVSLCLLVGIWWLYRRRINQVRLEENKKREVEQKMNTLRMQALQSQMNPHFVFNSMNAIQTFIGRNDQKAALEYLADFGLLMRMSLQHMREDALKIEEINQFVGLYLKLENLRFDNSINFSISCEPLSIKQLKIPPFIIQPIVENAVQHGLNSPSLLTKKIDIAYTLRKKRLTCDITDNGIGRQKSKRNTKKHKSVGLDNVRTRLSLLSEDSKLLIEDLYIKGEAAGTKVKIEIELND